MGKCALETFSLESDQSLALELAKHDPFGRPEVVFGVCIALRGPGRSNSLSHASRGVTLI